MASVELFDAIKSLTRQCYETMQASPRQGPFLSNSIMKSDNVKKKRRSRGRRIFMSYAEESPSASPVHHRNPRISPKPSTSKGTSVQREERKSPKKSTSTESVKFEFSIKPVTTPKSGIPIRKRNSVKKYVSLKSFRTDKIKTCVFATGKPVVETLAVSLQKVSFNATTSKIERRKYSTEKRKKKDIDNEPFPKYSTVDQVQQGLADGSLVKGFIRINQNNCHNSYVNNENQRLSDYYLTSVLDRNRALDGDEVVLEIKDKKEWVNGYKTARVVFIRKMNHPRVVVGSLRPNKKNKLTEFALFHPRDKKCPALRIPPLSWPNGFKENYRLYENTLFVATITSWDNPKYAMGMLTETLGLSGDLRVESISILREFCLDVTPFGDEVKEHLPRSKEISETELGCREDLRQECIFTIDPATARDLDDAVSAKALSNGNFEIGVHISDASYFVVEGTELDQIVSKKGTTIYLVDNVYHMLPVELCLHCSLLPGQDKLSFSVFWELTPEADIVKTRFTRSVMNSCVQLAYEHAQKIVEDPEGQFCSEDFPNIHNGFGIKDLVSTVTILQNVAVKLREKRVQNGALKIDQVKVLFTLDCTTGEPTEFHTYKNEDSHRLIEEFMLLANMSVAEKIEKCFPKMAFLRCHEPPKQTMLTSLKNCLAVYGIHLDVASSGGLSSSLKKYITDDYAGQCRAIALNHLTAKTMTRARYFCSSAADSEGFEHYALSVPMYTHFTSPIRRYADIMVHRLLAASLNYCEPPEWDEEYVSAIAGNCNKQKYNAKRAGEASTELYLAHYVEKHKPFVRECVVVDVKERSFEAIVLSTGSTVKIHKKTCEDGTTWETEPIALPTDNGAKTKPERENLKRQLKLTISFPRSKENPATRLLVETFSVVKICLEKRPGSYKLDGHLVRPFQTRIFERSGS